MDDGLEPNGWRQGSLARSADIPQLLSGLVESSDEDVELVIISQSCDLARNSDAEPFVEAIAAAPVQRPEGNFTFNKNSRTLDITVKVELAARASSTDKHLRLFATKKVLIPKKRFAMLAPSTRKILPLTTVHVLSEWLGARYSRSAFPTDFNNALSSCDPSSKKLRQIAKRMSPHTTALYLDVYPDRDLQPGERYRVNLLGVILPSAKKHREAVTKDVLALQALIQSAGIDISVAVSAEDEVSLARVKSMRRLCLDDISYRSKHPLPPQF